MGEGIAASHATARRLPAGEARLRDADLPPSGSVFHAPDLFVTAHYRHTLLRQFTEVRTSEKMDVLHLTAPLPVRMKRVKTVTTIHDLIPILLPWATPDNKSEFLDRVRTCAKLSDLIITVSETSKRDIVETLGVSPERVAVTWQPTDLAPLSSRDREDLPDVLSRFDLVLQGYALFVGAIEPKKNLRRLIEAFLKTDSSMPLVIVGRKAWMWEDQIGFVEGLDERKRSRLRFIGYAEKEDLRRLYAGARMFLFPSLYEGFGLPPLEAMNAGCPVITSTAGSLPEVCGDGAIYANAMDPIEIRQKIERLMGNDDLCARLGEAGRARAKLFSADAYRSVLGAAYEKLLKS